MLKLPEVQMNLIFLFTGHSASRSANPIVSQTLSIDTFNDGIIDTH